MCEMWVTEKFYISLSIYQIGMGELGVKKLMILFQLYPLELDFGRDHCW